MQDFSQQPASVRSDYLPFIAVFLLLSLHWLTGARTLPWDAMDQFYPTSRFITDSLRDGQLPWWNPYQYAGLPVFADPQSLLFTAFTPLGVLLGHTYTPGLFSAITLLHLLVGGCALIAYARDYATTPLQRVLAALVFALAGVATSRLQHVPQIVTYAYLPLLIWSAHRFIKHLRISNGCLLTLVLVLTFVNPNQVTLLGGLAVGYVTFLHWLQVQYKGRAALGLLLALTAALLLSSPVLAAVIELADLSNRAALTVIDSEHASMPRSSLLAFAFPGAFGTGGWHRVSWTPNDITENWLYLGAGASLLLAQILLTRRLRAPWLLPALIFFVLFALGLNSSLYPWLFEHVPGFNLFRRPSDAIYPVLLLLSLLLLQPHGFVDSPSKTLWLSLLTMAGLVILIALSSLWGYAIQRSQSEAFIENIFLALLRYAVIIALFYWAQRHWQHLWQYSPIPVVLLAICIAAEMVIPARFREFRGNSKTWAVGQLYDGHIRNEPAKELQQLVHMLQGRPDDDIKTPQFRFEVSIGDLGNANTSGLRVQSMQGYNPMRLKSYDTILGTTVSNSPRWFTTQAPHYNHSWFQALGLRYVILSTAQLESTRVDDNFIKAAHQQRDQLATFAIKHPSPLAGYEIWELPSRYPPIWLSHHETIQADRPSPPDESLGQCQLNKKETHRITARCDVRSTATVIFSELHHPGWHACVDRKPAQLNQAWGLLQAVQLTPGKHTVTLQFEPIPFWRVRKCSE